MPPTVAIEGVAEIVLAVTDLPAAVAFYHDLLGLPLKAQGEDRAWLFAGDTLVGLWRARPDAPGGPEEMRLHAPPQEGAAGAQGGRHVHFALRVPQDRFEESVRALRARGIYIRDARATGGSRSVFFDDPDGNVLEITDATPLRPLIHHV